MKKRFISFIFLSLCWGTLHAQVEENIAEVKKELVKVRLVNSENIPAVNFRVKLTPENIETTTDDTGYFELYSSTKNEKLYVYNPYTSGYHWVFSITFSPEDDVDTTHVLTIDWSVIGKVVNSEGRPMLGMKVEVLGKDKSATTDGYGAFDLKNLTYKDRLIITDPNKLYKEQEVQVAFTNKETRITLARYIPAILASHKDTTGVMYITDKTPQNRNTSTPEFSNIKSFKYKNGEYTIKEINRKARLHGTQVQYRSGMDITWMGRLPELQKEYAQGQTNGTGLEWRGADKNEMFSWGPAINDLEYSNVAGYPFDRNGSLVAKGSGNGIPANTYDSKDFFRTGISYKNEINANFAFIANSILSLTLDQNKVNSPIPNSYLEAYKGGVAINKLQTGKLISDIGITMKHTHEKLMNNGASYAQLLHAIYTTPATFDNRNGLSKGDAIKNSESWELQNGSMRSYAPLSAYNPYYIMSNFPDKESRDDLLAYAKTKYTLDKFELEGLFSYNKQWNDRTTRNNQANQLVRESELSNLDAGINASYSLNDKINFKLSYLFDKNDESFEYKASAISDKFSRKSHQISYAMYFNNRNININLSNKHYFSNTANDFTNLFPYLGVNVSLEQLWYKLFNSYNRSPFRNLSLFGSASRTLGEAPLLYKSKAALSANMHSSQFHDFYEWQEIPFHDKLKPEVYINTEVGLRKYMLKSRLFLEAIYFHNTTWDFVAPYTPNISSVSLENLGRVHNYGYLFSTSYNSNAYYYRKVSGGISLGLNLTKSKVSSVNHPNSAIALAGFSNIRTVFAKDEPLGVIYGTSYQRNSEGHIIVGSDGYPLVDNQLKKIGDPTPDFRLTLTPHIKWNFITLTMLMEYSHGGDRWNGTNAYLDYAGMSKESAELRNTKGFIYDGVTQSGVQNTQAVDFYNPTDNLSQNRWVRYGMQGVGENYIEDASYFRLREISLSFNLWSLVNRIFSDEIIKDFEVEARLYNILLITDYKGVDPESTLFGYATGKGLDLFNTPSSRSFSFSINLKF